MIVLHTFTAQSLLLQPLHIQLSLSQSDLGQDEAARRGSRVFSDSHFLPGSGHVDLNNSRVNNEVMELGEDMIRLLSVGHGHKSITFAASVIEDDLRIQNCSKPAEQLDQVVFPEISNMDE